MNKKLSQNHFPNNKGSKITVEFGKPLKCSNQNLMVYEKHSSKLNLELFCMLLQKLETQTNSYFEHSSKQKYLFGFALN